MREVEAEQMTTHDRKKESNNEFKRFFKIK